MINNLLFSGDLWASSPGHLTAQPYEWSWRMHHIWSGGWAIAMIVGMIAFWVLILALCFIGLRRLLIRPASPRQDQAITILRERFARGEIDKEEFEARKQQLS